MPRQSNKKLFNRFFSRAKAAIPDRRIENEQFVELHKFIGELRDLMNEQSNQIDEIAHQISRIDNVVSKHYDRIPELRKQLLVIRQSKAYEDIFEDNNPLITVRIATYNNARLLIERAIASVYKQSYKNWEIIVVGDGCSDETEVEINKLSDDRIKFFNFPYRNVYPENARLRWQVAGSPGMNKGCRASLWILDCSFRR